MKKIIFQIGIILVLGLIVNNTINPHKIKWVGSFKSADDVDGVVAGGNDLTDRIIGAVEASSDTPVVDPTESGTDLPIIPTDDSGEVQIYEMSLEDVYKLYESGKVVFIDARYPADYDVECIEGAINLPVDMFDECYPDVADFFGIDDALIIYCSGPGCDLSAVLADVLRDMGYTKLMLFEAGLPAWKEAGYPTE